MARAPAETRRMSLSVHDVLQRADLDDGLSDGFINLESARAKATLTRHLSTPLAVLDALDAGVDQRIDVSEALSSPKLALRQPAPSALPELAEWLKPQPLRPFPTRADLTSIHVAQLRLASGRLDSLNNCIAASLLMMLRAAEVVRPDVSIATFTARLRALGVRVHTITRASTQDDFNRLAGRLARDPSVGTGRDLSVRLVALSHDSAMQAMRRGEVVMGYVDWHSSGGVSHHRSHVVAMAYAPELAQYRLLDPLRDAEAGIGWLHVAGGPMWRSGYAPSQGGWRLFGLEVREGESGAR